MMSVVNSLEALQQVAGPVVLAVGTFDGIHRGHQAVIRQAVATAARMRISPSLVAPRPVKCANSPTCRV